MKQTVVRAYKSRRQMQRGVERMAARGYEIAQQSGEFTTNPFTFRWNRRKVAVTFRAVQRGSAPAPSLAGEDE